MPRVLVIDDQTFVRAALRVALQAKGFDVVTADDGASGLRAFKASNFDLAIVDLYMPGIDGVRLIKSLRDCSPRLPIIAMSGVFLRDSGRSALDFLPDLPGLSKIVCLRKPIRSPELLEAIEAAIAAAA